MASTHAVKAVIIIGALLFFCSLYIDAKEWNDVENCGKCKHQCPRPHHSTPTCKHGKCGFKCKPGFRDCDEKKSNGCETGVTGDLSNCGRCDHVCPDPPRGGGGGRGGRGGGGSVGEATCINGVCGLDCGKSTGLANCDGILRNGCETDIWYSTQDCGGCDHVCPVPPNAFASCNLGTCTFICITGFADCDGHASNGCEVDLSTVTNPGTCGPCTTDVDCANVLPYATCFESVCTKLSVP